MDLTITYSSNELENAIDYLEQTSYYYERKNYDHRFKWLMISLHGALYGFCVLAVKGTSPTQTVYKSLDKVINNKGRLREAREIISKYYNVTDETYIDIYVQLSKGKLLDIYNVLERCQNESDMRMFTDSKVLVLSEEQSLAIGKLVNHRNQFAHFKPMQYAITGDYDFSIVYPVLEVIRFLALESNNVMYYQEEQRVRVENTFTRLCPKING
ncbi:hypothetical protein ACFPES_03140 [Paenibacillus sp. GCM10023248]|uniref:hypothetical protein n=1 Tax=unclassified Paenibacillus TaxID=185978 RepID=UPI002379A3FE|nr:hypothetical protein [Paenibacillus sp. MAHUQ-63]MDD9266020.1 hypothetical protein [Paenibacillus sp. MAHUQ-63]